VGAGFSLHVTRRSQDAVDAFRPVYEKLFANRVDTYNDFDSSVLFHSYEDYLARSAALIGSPQQVIDKLAAYQEAYGYSAISIPGHPDHSTREQWIDSLELFRGEVLPVVDKTVAGPASW